MTSPTSIEFTNSRFEEGSNEPPPPFGVPIRPRKDNRVLEAGRLIESADARVFHYFHAFAARLRRHICDFVRSHGMPYQGRRFDGKGLRGPGFFSWDPAGRHFPFFNLKDKRSRAQHHTRASQLHPQGDDKLEHISMLCAERHTLGSSARGW